MYFEAHHIWTAHVGDSRAVLSRRGEVIPLTEDHKPTIPEERTRIEEAGGRIDWFGAMDRFGKPIPGSGVYRVNENLAMTRAIGDRLEKPSITAQPTVQKLDRDIAGDQFIVIGSDGLWDVMTNQKVVDFVHAQLVHGIQTNQMVKV